MGLELELKQKQILTTQMIQSMEILQMSAQELEQYINKMAMENPVMDLPDVNMEKADLQKADIQRKMDWLESTDYRNRVYYQQDRSAEDMEQNWHDKREQEISLHDFLAAQVDWSAYSKKEQIILDFLLQSLDSRGYFTEDIKETAKYLSVSEEQIFTLLFEIQKLDPAGVGARNLKECLLLQLERKPEQKDMGIVKEIVRHHLESVGKNHLEKIAKMMKITTKEVQAACKVIQTLNPKPGNYFSDREQLRYISPDVIVVKLEQEFEILVNEYQYPSFSINSYYLKMRNDVFDAETKKYLQNKISQAEWILRCISLRTSTLSKVVRLLVEKQSDFFIYGPGHKKPLKLKDLSEELLVHESTVSRALSNKYLQCSFGIFPLNYFLTQTVAKGSGEGQEKTPEQVKALIRKVIDQEDKKSPLSDQKISDALRECQVVISRRTVNKYRQEMEIPDKNGRKKW